MSTRKLKPTDDKLGVTDPLLAEGHGQSRTGLVKRIKKRTRTKIAPKFLLTIYKMIEVR